MKKIYFTLAFWATTLAAFSQDYLTWDKERNLVIIGKPDNQVHTLVLNEPFVGYKGSTLIVRGTVELSHKNEDIYSANPQTIEVKFDTIVFEENSKLLTRSNLMIAATKYIKGDIVILSSRGIKGKDAKSVTQIPPKAPNGSNGTNGRDGDKAEVGKSAEDGSNGTFGGNGGEGVNGTPGQNGERGSNGASIILEVMTFHPEATFNLASLGGKGGRGGDGGVGGEGGNGGNGGNGGKGGRSSVPKRDGGNGGKGGDGGHGGNGGNGGAGGNGGPGGNGGNTYIYFSAEPPADWTLNRETVQFSCLAGKGGDPGLGGIGGAGGLGGKGGNGGQGRRGTVVNMDEILIDGGDGDNGPDGARGRDGQPGLNGPDGQRGPDGIPGLNGRLSVRRTEPREPSFYELKSENEFTLPPTL